MGILPPQADLRREAEARLASVDATLSNDKTAAMPAPAAVPTTGKLVDPADDPAADQTLVAQFPPPAATDSANDATVVNWSPPT